MTLPTELDTWVAALGTALGIHATRDPAMIHPPCVYAAAPDTAKVTLGATTLQLPVWLLPGGEGKSALDAALVLLPNLLAACQAKTADWSTLTVSGVDFPGYLITTPLHITPA
jgi:hypothetical protein